MTTHWTQSPLPHFHDNETGQFFAPGYEGENTPFPINPAEWRHVTSCRFGEARQVGSNTKWTGDSYRYDIFTRDDERRPRMALRWWNGIGQGWLLEDVRTYRGETSMLARIASEPDENQRWDMAHFLWQTFTQSARAAALATDRSIRRAIAENRVRKQKVRGQSAFRITILSAAELEWQNARKFARQQLNA